MRKFKIVVTERGRREMAEAEEEKNKKRDKKASTWIWKKKITFDLIKMNDGWCWGGEEQETGQKNFQVKIKEKKE